jgi:hypothetical protein
VLHALQKRFQQATQLVNLRLLLFQAVASVPGATLDKRALYNAGVPAYEQQV